MDDDEFVVDFLVESHENLDQLDQDLVTLEADTINPEVLSRVFRTIHTIKGTCGFLGFTKLEWVTHVGENLLSRLRDGELQLNAEITTALLSLVDAVRQILASIETTKGEGDGDYEPLVATLTRLQKGSAGVAEAAPATDKVSARPDARADVAKADVAKADVANVAMPDADVADADVADADVADADGVTEVAAESQLDAPGAHVSETSHARIDQRVEQYLMESYEHADQLDRDLVTLESDPANPELLSRVFGTLHTLKSSSGFLGFTVVETAVHAGESLLCSLRDGTCQLNPEITTALLSLVDTLRQSLVAIETAGDAEQVDFVPLIETLRRLQDASQAAPAPVTKDAAVSPTARAPSVAETSIRVDVRLLDTLMDEVGELVLARNRIMQFATHQQNRDVIAAYQRLDLITSELQEGVMKTRMQPIGTIWNKFPRVVRDLARDCGKQVNLNMEGQETELDRTLIEAIRDPLTHLVRNAVDHGIETPETRRAAGKSETGTLFLRAFHEGGQVNIGISDDGGGIEPQRIVQRALECHLITEGQAAQLSDREILDLIFAPGFSTAKTVTNVSGRGVGMDVVKTNIERINGTIDIQSQVGHGSTIRIKIPLTLAIIPALIIRCAGDRYAIPQASLIELVRLEGDQAHRKIETIQGAPVYRLRGKLLPLVFLQDELAVAADATSTRREDDDNHVINIVVLQADERQFGLVVENVLDTEEIVVKPLEKQLKDMVAVFAGATIMGDGNVALILDVLGLAQRSRVLSERRQALPTDLSSRERGRIANYQTLLLFESPTGQRMALPLSRVTRLEKFAWADVERSGPCEVVQYWGQVMPLIHLSKCLSGEELLLSPTDPADREQESLEVVALTTQSRSIGLVVGHILDTVEDEFEIQPLRSRAGVIGTVVVQGRVTELLDLDAIVQVVKPALFAEPASTGVEG